MKGKSRKAIIKLFNVVGMWFKRNNTNQPQDCQFPGHEMNLDTSTYLAHRKPDNMPLYINRKSNHPPTIIKEIL